MKTIGIYNPYWDSLGGGERYSLFFALSSLKLGYEVSLYWKDSSLLTDLEKRYGISTKGLQVNTEAWETLKSGSIWAKRKILSALDVIFWVSDGSLPWLWSKKSYIHFQVPFSKGLTNITDRIKVSLYSNAVINSGFTQRIIKTWYPGKTMVIYPPAHTFTPLTKENIILSVGRFDQTMQAKRHDVLIDVFESLKTKDWKLILAGGVLHGEDVVERLRERAKELPVEIITNPDFKELNVLYGRAKLYWHAAGFGADMDKEPEKLEHFGITTVEAMSTGAVPLVYGAGGQTEIITHGEDGYLWHSKEELAQLTESLFSNEALYDKLAGQARKTHTRFNEEAFFNATAKLLS